MEPRIQYATTRDGVSIAYTVLGGGTPLAIASSSFGSLHMYARGPRGVPYLEDSLVAEGFRVVIYDGRGVGFSDRSATDFYARARVLDLEAAVEAAGFERFVMVVSGTGAMAAVTYANEHRENVSHLVAVNTWTAIRELREKLPYVRIMQVLREIADEEWEYVTLTIAKLFWELADNDEAQAYAAAFRDSMTPAAWVAEQQATDGTDLGQSLAFLSVPSLVIHDSSRFGRRMREIAQRLAPRIPGARFVETDNPARAIREFVGTSTPEQRAELPSGMTAILFTDIVDSTALTERLGDAAFRAKARDLDGALRGVIREHGGTCIEAKTLGDGVLAVFTSARQAIEAALACGTAGDKASLPLHLGLHAGDVLRESDPDGRANVYGGAVNIAARISGLSAPGEVLVSDVVRTLARTSAGVGFEDRGEQALKGVGEAVRVWAVRQG